MEVDIGIEIVHHTQGATDDGKRQRDFFKLPVRQIAPYIKASEHHHPEGAQANVQNQVGLVGGENGKVRHRLVGKKQKLDHIKTDHRDQVSLAVFEPGVHRIRRGVLRCERDGALQSIKLFRAESRGRAASRHGRSFLSGFLG